MFGCPYTISRMRTYSLRKPCFTSSFRYLQRGHQWMVWYPFFHGRSSIPPTQRAKDCSRRSRTSHPWLIFDNVEDFVDRELPRSEVFHQSVASEQTRGESGVIASSKRATPGVDLERGWELHKDTLAFLHYRPVVRGGWRKPSLSPLVLCKSELQKGLRSS